MIDPRLLLIMAGANFMAAIGCIITGDLDLMVLAAVNIVFGYLCFHYSWGLLGLAIKIADFCVSEAKKNADDERTRS